MSFDPTLYPDLPSTAKLVAGLLDAKTARVHERTFFASATIARWVRRSVRTVQLALKALRDAGLIAVRVTRRVNSGHVITLKWRTGEAPAGTNSFGATACARPAPEVAPAPEVPPDPPMEVPEGAKGPEIDGGAGTPPRTSFSRPVPDPAPEVPAALVERALKLNPSEGNARGKFRPLLARFGPDWVRAAMDHAERLHRAEPVQKLFAYLNRTLLGFEEEGGAPAPEPDPAERKAREDAEREAFRARLIAKFEARDRERAALLGDL